MSFRAPNFKWCSTASSSPDKTEPFAVVPVAERGRQRLQGVTLFPRMDLHIPEGRFIQPVTRSPSRSSDYLSDFDNESGEPMMHTATVSKLQTSSTSKKKLKQWNTWKNEVIPELLMVYLRVLSESQSLRTMEQCEALHCQCGATRRKITVTCIYFDSE